MPDKLPIFVERKSLAMIREGRAQRGIVGGERHAFDTIDLHAEERAGMIRYEPAVPRCKTCARNGPGTCLMFGALISDDDYCSNHPEART